MDKFWKSKKSFEKSKGKILEIKKSCQKIKRTIGKSKQMIILVILLEHRAKNNILLLHDDNTIGTFTFFFPELQENICLFAIALFFSS